MVARSFHKEVTTVLFLQLKSTSYINNVWNQKYLQVIGNCYVTLWDSLVISFPFDAHSRGNSLKKPNNIWKFKKTIYITKVNQTTEIRKQKAIGQVHARCNWCYTYTPISMTNFSTPLSLHICNPTERYWTLLSSTTTRWISTWTLLLHPSCWKL